MYFVSYSYSKGFGYSILTGDLPTTKDEIDDVIKAIRETASVQNVIPISFHMMADSPKAPMGNPISAGARLRSTAEPVSEAERLRAKLRDARNRLEAIREDDPSFTLEDDIAAIDAVLGDARPVR